jgi:hypothetical protein
MCLKFFIKFNKTASRKWNGQNMSDLCRDTVANTPSGPSYFLLAGRFFLFFFYPHTSVPGDTVRDAPKDLYFIGANTKMSPLLYKHCRQGQYSLSFSQRIANTLKVLLKWSLNGALPSMSCTHLDISWTFS